LDTDLKSVPRYSEIYFNCYNWAISLPYCG
jgi:hypothetical protein